MGVIISHFGRFIFSAVLGVAYRVGRAGVQFTDLVKCSLFLNH